MMEKAMNEDEIAFTMMSLGWSSPVLSLSRNGLFSL